MNTDLLLTEVFLELPVRREQTAVLSKVELWVSERCRISADFGLPREDFSAQLGHTQGLRLLVS